jgi:hypothetical protein
MTKKEKKQELKEFMDRAFGRTKQAPGPAAQVRAKRKPPGADKRGQYSAAALEKQAIDEMILEQEQQLAALRKRQTALARQLTAGIEKFGVVPESDPDRVVLESTGFQAQKRWNGGGRVIDSERVGEVFPELRTSEEIVNLTILSEVVLNANIPRSKPLLSKFKKLIHHIESKIGAQLVEKQGDGGIDLSRYAAYKQSGRITPKQAEVFEHIEGPLKVTKTTKRRSGGSV